MPTSTLESYPDAVTLAHAAAAYVVQCGQAAIAARGSFSLALSGGSTPRALYSLLAELPYREQLDWSKVSVYWGDERCVPPDSADSNYAMAYATLLAHVPVPPTQIYRIQGELDPQAAATAYEAILRMTLGSAARLDLLLLGIGDDGHTASLFPYTTALQETERWVVANYVEKLGVWRVTLTYPVLNAARQVAFVVAGTQKRDVLQRIRAGMYQPDELPAQGIQPIAGTVTWLVAVD